MLQNPSEQAEKMASYASKSVKYPKKKKKNKYIQIQKLASHPIKEDDRVTLRKRLEIQYVITSVQENSSIVASYTQQSSNLPKCLSRNRTEEDA
jgi:hypothetical protein